MCGRNFLECHGLKSFSWMCALILKFNLNSSIIKSPEKGWGYPVNTEITNALKATSDTAQYDNSAKRLLGNKYILAQILVYLFGRVPRPKYFGRGWMPLFFFFLVTNVPPYYFFRTFTDAANEVAEAPEIRLPVVWLQNFCVVLPYHPWWRWFQRIYKLCQVELRWGIKQDMYVIRHEVYFQ